MSSRLFPLFGLSLAILAACGGPATVSYRLTFDSTDPATVEELSKAAIRVAERRLDRLGATITEQKIAKDVDGVTVELRISDAASAEALTSELTAPFDMQIMVETTEQADITVEGFGGFKLTPVNGDDIVNILAAMNPEDKTGVVRINFTPEGLEEMRDLFRANVGKNIGLFVRGRLVSALTVESADLPNPLVIDGIPNVEMAMIFADDVNVGLHVTVTPL